MAAFVYNATTGVVGRAASTMRRVRAHSLYYKGVLASTAIPACCLVALNGGYADNATSTSTCILGVSRASSDNSSGSSGDKNVEYETGSVWLVNGDSIATADIGKAAFVLDNQTVTKSSNGGARLRCGTIDDVDATKGVCVDLDPPPSALMGTNEPTIRSVLVPYDGDAAASTTLAEAIVGCFPEAGAVKAIKIHPTGALTASDTVYATITLAARDGIGGAAATLATVVTNVAGGSWTAFTKKDAGAITNPTVVAGGDLTLTIAKASTGTQIPRSVIEVQYVPTRLGA